MPAGPIRVFRGLRVWIGERESLATERKFSDDLPENKTGDTIN